MANGLICSIGILLCVFGIVFGARAIITSKRDFYEDRQHGSTVNHKKKLMPVILSALGLFLVVLSASFVIIPTGYTGVKSVLGIVSEEPVPYGFNGVIPFATKINLVNNKYQTFTEDDKVWSESAEQTAVYAMGTEVVYQISSDASAWVYINVQNYEKNLLTKRIVDDAIKAGTRKVKTTDVTNRDVVCGKIKESLQAAVDKLYGKNVVTIHNIAIADMDFEDAYIQAISERQQAVVNQEKQAILNETNIKKAEAEAEAARVKAQGEADAVLIEAEGKAEANRKIAESITDATQRQDAIERWNGELPKYVGGQDVSFGILDTTSVD